MNTMKLLSMALVVGGVAVCASFGARLSPPMRAELSMQGTASMAEGRAKKALGAYCEALAKADLEPACPDYKPPAPAAGSPEPAAKPAEIAVKPPKPTEAELLAKGGAAVDALRASAPAGQAPALATLRTAWIEAKAAAVAPSARAATTPPVPPTERLSAWFADSGLLFLLGLGAVLAGAIIGRKVARAEALGHGPTKDGAPAAVDFGALLGTLADEMKAMLATMPEGGDSAANRLRIRQEVEVLQRSRFEPLVAARGRLQARYGLAAYAEIFGPLSGAERRVNRVWTALVDQHYPEARDSLSNALLQIDAAREALAAVTARAA